MFNLGTRGYFDRLPDLVGLEPGEARRVLSAAFADVIAARDAFTRSSGPDREAVGGYLRRLASALESYAIFDETAPAERQEASAFVAAESLALINETDESDNRPNHGYRFADGKTYAACEAGLLYMVSGFDSNAATIARSIPGAHGADANCEQRNAEAALDAITELLELRARPGMNPDQLDTEDPDLHVRVRAAAFRTLAVVAHNFVAWLTMTRDTYEGEVISLIALADTLDEVRAVQHSDIRHLARLLRAAIQSVARRALREIPGPDDPRYAAYISARSKERPVAFPTALDYASSCLPGPSRNAAVSQPTGSGKSFIAEVAAAQALTDGWVLYLVPTNALASQVRRDLARGLRHLEDAAVRAFIGGGEYTELSGEVIGDAIQRQVMVMTPEKCSLALRLAPEAFASLRLCIFDECHLLAEPGQRGVIAELVISHVLALSPQCVFLLLSALVENPDDLAQWLESVSGRESVSVRTSWRPTRTMRGIVGFVADETDALYQQARIRLAELPARRVNEKFDAPVASLVNLQGTWDELQESNYALLRLPITGQLVAHRERQGESWRYSVEAPGYVNRQIESLIAHLAIQGERVLAFMPGSKHYPFSVAENLELPEREVAPASQDHALVRAYLRLAEYELGAPSALDDLFRKGVVVHTSALVDAERMASEEAYQRSVADVMVATGTLAQGLNLPATVVLVGGTQIGYDDGPTADIDAQLRSRAQLLNAVGRAGRPGFTNRGVALVVPNNPLFVTRPEDVAVAIQRAPVLTYEDASVSVQSRLASLIRGSLDGALTSAALSAEEMAAYTYLPSGTDDGLSGRILRRSFGLWSTEAPPEDTATAVVASLDRVGNEFVAQADVPPWTAEVAYRSGLTLPVVFALYQLTAARAAEGLPETAVDWVGFFLDVLSRMPQHLIREVFAADDREAGFRFSAAWGYQPGTAEDWDALRATLDSFVSGAPLAEVAAVAIGVNPPIDLGRTTGQKPLPKTIVFLNAMAYRLSLAAGGLGAMFAVGSANEPDGRWELNARQQQSLEMLPLVLRSGCGDPSSLAWYRFGCRYRRPAHFLSDLYPLPPDLVADELVRPWILARRAELLERGNSGGDEESILDAIRTVLGE